MFDANYAFRAIYYTLANDSTLMGLVTDVVEGKYKLAETSPEDAYPFVNIVPFQPTDVYYNGHARAKVDQMAAVYGIQRFESDGSYAGTLGQIADRIDTLLHGKTISVLDTDDTTEIGKAYIYRESAIRETFQDGVEYRYLGGNYSISTSKK